MGSIDSLEPISFQRSSQTQQFLTKSCSTLTLILGTFHLKKRFGTHQLRILTVLLSVPVFCLVPIQSCRIPRSVISKNIFLHGESIHLLTHSWYLYQIIVKIPYFHYYKTHLYLFFSVFGATYNRNLEDFYLINMCIQGVFYSSASSIQKCLIIAKIRYK